MSFTCPEVPLPKYEIIKTPREREEKPEKQVKEQILERVKTTVKQEVQVHSFNSHASLHSYPNRGLTGRDSALVSNVL